MNELTTETGISFIAKKDIPVKSPDAIPLDFFDLKTRLEKRKPETITGLLRAASQEWSTISSEKCLEVFESWRKRLVVIEKVQGLHIEQLKKIHNKPINHSN